MPVQVKKEGDAFPVVKSAEGDQSKGTHIASTAFAEDLPLELGSFSGADIPPGGAKITVSPMGYLISTEFEGGGEERYAINFSEFDHFKGRVLTMVDATFSDPVQREAFKDILKGEFREWEQGIMRNAARDAGLPEMAFYIGGVLDSIQR